MSNTKAKVQKPLELDHSRNVANPCVSSLPGHTTSPTYISVCLCFCTPAKVVDLDHSLTKKPVEDSACHYNTRGSMSEVQSLSSFQSESCDDNGMHLNRNGQPLFIDKCPNVLTRLIYTRSEPSLVVYRPIFVLVDLNMFFYFGCIILNSRSSTSDLCMFAVDSTRGDACGKLFWFLFDCSSL